MNYSQSGPSMNYNQGGPAFPDGSINQWGNANNSGMTLRDYFAAKAMQALIEKTELMMQAILEDGTHHGTPDQIMALHKAAICESAYKYADAMLRAREENT